MSSVVHEMVELYMTHRVTQAGIRQREMLRTEMVRVELDAIEGWRSRGEISPNTYATLRRDITETLSPRSQA